MSVLAPLYRPLWQRRTYVTSAYFLWSLVTSVLWFTLAVTLYATSVGLVVVWVGVPMLVVVHRWVRWVGDIERRQVNACLGLELPPVPPLVLGPPQSPDHPHIARFGTWMHTVFHDPYTWRALAWIGLRVVLGPIAFSLALTVWVTLSTLALAPVGLLIPGVEFADGYGGLAWVTAAGPVAAVLMAPMLVWTLKAWASVHTMVACWALGPSQADHTKAAVERAELAEQQVRIDQELHDSIGHMITMNVVQAGAGAHVFDHDPEFARQALRNIEQRGRVALAELDRIIATLRGDQAQPLAPLPGLRDISELVDASREAGIDIDAVVTDVDVPEALGRATYRIVREAVTNAAKHAPGSLVHVHVQRQADALAVAVVNGASPTGQTAPSEHRQAHRERRGLAGIRDRVALLGGVSDIGPTDEGGFCVKALLPTAAEFTADDTGDATCCAWASLRAKVVS